MVWNAVLSEGISATDKQNNKHPVVHGLQREEILLLLLLDVLYFLPSLIGVGIVIVCVFDGDGKKNLCVLFEFSIEK